MIWSVEHPERAQRERAELEALVSRADWLVPGEWRMDTSLRQIWDADIRIGDRTYVISLRYPNHFPHSPPLVLPRDETARWSSHQWGAGGELCLEFGADNWHPDITGAAMIESAHRLLLVENPPSGENGMVASRHATTLGQDLRSERMRFVLTRSAASFMKTLAAGKMCEASVVGTYRERSAVYVLDWAMDLAGEKWTDASVPRTVVDEGYALQAMILCWPGDQPLPRVTTRADLYDAALAIGFSVPDVRYVLIVKGEVFRGYAVWDDNTAQRLSMVLPQREVGRLDPEHAALAARSVAIVGCGSLGSKVAAMLARAGVCKFLLVDDDVMLPDNVVRNDLDWREVGYHKVDAVARRIELVNPDAARDVRKYRLGGQHSSDSVETLIEALGTFDLIVDVSADARVFNYLCAAVSVGRKAMVWARVFGGGFGGLIARHRHGIEPDPATMRAQIEQWSVDQGLPPERAGQDYETRGDDGPMIADDADVTAIAAHAARLAIDTLIPRAPSMFPTSVYMIGLSQRWVFQQPFDTRPIDVGVAAATFPSTPDLELARLETERIQALLKKLINETAAATSGPETTP
ncbi:MULTISPECIES: ThiF family adenylyltransferase [unclassified Bradyrhizobium]|uniref:ThiF family adenylyltransferase n=1 Tax=unclassified Bradyrhizobium TaxID=2631580 RepID=UPI001FFA3061|nr:ThiF family adenylyltransferase [Bradyrhizobium sp. 143]